MTKQQAITLQEGVTFVYMVTIQQFTFNPFYENTYVLSDETGACVIIDPGCHVADEEQELEAYIVKNNLRPEHLLLTHGHVDHVFGNHFVTQRWGLGITVHPMDIPTLQAFPQVCAMYGFHGYVQDAPSALLQEGTSVKFGVTELDVFFTPGHSPGSVCFYHRDQGFVIGGDVLFEGSIGRTDLPGGNFDVLAHSIRTKLYVLPDATVVHPGHGSATTIGREKRSNPFVIG
jgi:hydroxyacylglutathione hydrolase